MGRPDIGNTIKVESNIISGLKLNAHYIIAYSGSYWNNVPINGGTCVNYTVVANYGSLYFIMTHIITTSTTISISNINAGGLTAYYICDN